MIETEIHIYTGIHIYVPHTHTNTRIQRNTAIYLHVHTHRDIHRGTHMHTHIRMYKNSGGLNVNGLHVFILSGTITVSYTHLTLPTTTRV